MLLDLRAETLSIEGFNGDSIEAYFAQPLTTDPVGGVVVIHHLPGYDKATKEITRRFASEGYLPMTRRQQRARTVACPTSVSWVM